MALVVLFLNIGLFYTGAGLTVVSIVDGHRFPAAAPTPTPCCQPPAGRMLRSMERKIGE